MKVWPASVFDQCLTATVSESRYRLAACRFARVDLCVGLPAVTLSPQRDNSPAARLAAPVAAASF
jgi:hypothetical protein